MIGPDPMLFAKQRFFHMMSWENSVAQRLLGLSMEVVGVLKTRLFEGPKSIGGPWWFNFDPRPHVKSLRPCCFTPLQFHGNPKKGFKTLPEEKDHQRLGRD